MTRRSVAFLLMFPTFKDICRKADSIWVLLLVDTKHLDGRNQARIVQCQHRPSVNRINYPLPSLLFLETFGHAEEVKF